MTINKNMSYEYGMVNGKGCSYVKLGKYNDCSRAEVRSTQVPVGNYNSANAIPSAAQVAAANAAMQASTVSPSIVSLDGTTAPIVNSASTLVGVNEPYVDTANYVPSYNVPNYPPINTVSLTHGVQGSCGGYFNIMDAYGENSGNCVTNFINN